LQNLDLSIRIIISKSSFNLQEYHNTKETLRDRLELRLLPDENVRVAMAMNEEITGIAFPDLRGKIDFDSGFTSDDGEGGNSDSQMV
jgi:hypothetical protein